MNVIMKKNQQILPLNFSKMVIDTGSKFFNGLSHDISHIVVAQNFIVSSCLSYVDNTDVVNFLEDYNRYRLETIRVN